MRLPPRTDQLRTYRLKLDGSIREEDPIPLRNTLFAYAYGADHAALLRLEVPDAEGFDAMGQRLRLAKALQKGVRGLKVLGAGHGVKQGKVYAATPEIIQLVHRFFATAEDALAYGGLLFSEAMTVLRLSSARVTGRGLGDGQGWIDADVLREHGLPVRQTQVRSLWPKALAKGTLLPVEGMKAKEHCEVLFHETMLKSVGKDVAGDFLLAIRDTAEVRPMRSSWTWTQFLDEDLQERLFERYARPSLNFVRRAMESNDSALSFLDGIQTETGEEKETRDLLTAFLSAGLSPRHPWVHGKMQSLVRRSYLDAALGLGPVPMAGGMAAYLDDDRCKHHVTCNTAPEGNYALIRYPVRDPDSIRLVRNIHKPGVPEGSIAVHPELIASLDGDYDGDWIALCRDRDVQRGVARMHRSSYPRLPIPPRTRKRSPLSALPLVAVDALGASGIGTPTWLVAACVSGGRHDLVPGLSLALQVGTMGLKWSVDRDYDFMRAVSRNVKVPEWIQKAKDRRAFSTEAPRVPDVGLGRFWNLAAEAFARDSIGTRGDLQEYAHVVPLPDGDPEVLAETETMRQAFNRRVAASEGDEDEVRAAIRVVRDWGTGKTGPKREDYGRAAWFMAHRSRSLKSTASFAIHAFPDVLVKDIQETTGYRTPVSAGSCSTAHSLVETVEGRPVQRSRRPVHAPVKGNGTPTTLVRLIGGQKAIEAMYGATEDEARLFLEQTVEGAGYDPVEVNLRWVTAPWNGHRVLRADLQGDPVGYVPEEQAEAIGERLAGKRTAMLLYRGKTVYATVNM